MADIIDGTPLVITNLGTQAALVLDGATATLPEKGVAAPVRLRSTVTRYPGNARPSTQILGVEEGDIEFRGRWRDTWMGLEGGAAEYSGRVRRLILTQAYVSVVWGDIDRRGFIKEFEPTYNAGGDIQWRLILQVVEADDANVIATPYPAAVSTRDLWETLHEVLAVVETVASTATEVNNVAHAVVGLGEAA